MMRDQASRLSSSGTARLLMPALLTRMSRRPEAGNNLSDDVSPGVLAGHVGVNEDALAAGLVDFGFHLAAVVVADVGDDYFRAFAGEEAGLHGAHAVRTAADDGDLAFQSHCFISEDAARPTAGRQSCKSVGCGTG